MAKESEPVAADCRKCRWRGGVQRGVSVECRKRVLFARDIIPWHDATEHGLPCELFKARPVRRKAKGGTRR